ncbi:uncharacterized protein THITE_2088283 [Thermothielavioides terrestris NRRL 8126]|uniref:Uncharacterized protein n=1 Tax=Thermothielavioides terrestris (strain ATCC 38088 / NRRL 8126) TaxID=578455 RepID=G2R3J6_THETT|nr:uncharacterized protein THITE_2088283 [Thermothielavioides terrestris NRRL 8126]AEO66806.1 hypothetical protein THITE_2088283 [Thermothielavioides terrestris NRRL 8126]
MEQYRSRELPEAEPLRLPSLSFSTEWRRHPDACFQRPAESSRYDLAFRGKHVKLDMEAAVVRGKLVVHTVQRLLIPLRDRKPLRSGWWLGRGLIVDPQYHGFQTCRHEHPYFPHRKTDLRLCPRRQVEGQLGNHWLAMSSRQGLLSRVCNKRVPNIRRITKGECSYCPTKWVLTTYDHAIGGVEAVVDVWQNLGDCRSPLDPGWSFCWQAPCMKGGNGRHICSGWSSKADLGSFSPAAHQRLQEWKTANAIELDDETWCHLPVGESAIRHPSATSVMACWRKL